MSRPLVTVLIDTYNYGHFIEEAIETVLAQDFPAEEREILVVDDGSTDDTQERLRKFGDSIIYLKKQNGGQASAFNFGLEQARGEIVAFLDADDYWLPGKLRRIAEEFAKHPDAGMVYHAIRQLNSAQGVFQDGGLPLLSGFLPSNTKDLLSYVLYPTSFLAFRRSALAADSGGAEDSGGRTLVRTGYFSCADRGSAGMFGGLPDTRGKSVCGPAGDKRTAE